MVTKKLAADWFLCRAVGLKPDLQKTFRAAELRMDQSKQIILERGCDVLLSTLKKVFQPELKYCTVRKKM